MGIKRKPCSAADEHMSNALNAFEQSWKKVYSRTTTYYNQNMGYCRQNGPELCQLQTWFAVHPPAMQKFKMPETLHYSKHYRKHYTRHYQGPYE